jgi:hypothetical protein
VGWLGHEARKLVLPAGGAAVQPQLVASGLSSPRGHDYLIGSANFSATLRFATVIHQVRLGFQSHVALVIGQLFFLPEVPYVVSQKTKSYQ